MPSRGVPIEDLPPDAQRRVRSAARAATPVHPELGPNSPLLPGLVDEQLERSIKARRRIRAGQWFERELEADHSIYRAKGLAVIARRVPPMVKVKGEWKHARGKAPADFSGVVRGIGHVTFDAKSWEPATYRHEEDQYHQLEELRDVQLLSEPTAPTLAFLLIACQPLGIAYLVEDFEPLLRRQPIVLRTMKPKRTRAVMGTVEGFDHHYPFVRRAGGLLVAQDGLRWDWLPLLAGGG